MNNHPSPKQSSLRAFTLTELLVVIVIIVILFGLLLPVISAVRARAAQVKCTQNLRTWGVAILRYSQENNGEVRWNNWSSISTTARYYNPYFGTDSISVSGHGSRVTQEYYRWCPAQAWSGTGNAPVGYAFSRPSELTTSGTYWPSNDPYNLRRCERPSQLLLMIDAASSAVNVRGGGDFETAVKPICVGSALRHGGKVNALFADGHIGTFSWPDIDQDTQAEKDMVAAWFHLN